MKKSLTINATRDGKKVAKSFGYVNPDVANSLVGGFAQMVNALSNDTFVNSQVVKVMDTTEEETGGTTPAPAGLLDPQLECQDWGGKGVAINYLGDGQAFYVYTNGTVYEARRDDFGPAAEDLNFILVDSDGVYSQAWLKVESD